MAGKSFSTSNPTYKQLLSSGDVFHIPRFQRDYSWTEENWEDLWSDILDLANDPESDSHYMGYLVLQPKPGNKLDIIDGQQRMTTLSLLVLSGMRKLLELINAGIDPIDNQQRLDELRRTYIGRLDTVSLTVDAKLTLNRNNNHYYQTYLATMRDMPARGFKASEHSMRKATDWFSKKISEFLSGSEEGEEEYGKSIARLIDTLSSGLFFTTITVDDELNAYKVFETLNARGVKLAAPDLLKNYLFSIISKETDDSIHDLELDKVEGRWSDVLDRLQSENITTYLRTYWGANHAFVRQSDLFKVIKKSVPDRKSAYRLVEGLEEGVETYLSLTQPDLSPWSAEDKENALLLKMFSVRQPFALLMAMRSRIPAGFSQVLKAIVNITVRYNVISNLQAAEQERTYSRVAIGISEGKFSSANDVIKELKSIYPNDTVFKANFSDKILDTSNSRNKRVVRYLLAQLDAQITGATAVTPNSEITIEHIFPENPGEGWEHMADASSEVYRIGNMILLERKLNKDAGNQNFSKKKENLSLSDHFSAKDICENFDNWDVSSIGIRQAKLGNVATSIWRVSQLHS